jgi:hypothetical protein
VFESSGVKGTIVELTKKELFLTKKTTRVPIETVFITAKFSIISLSDSQAKVLILSESKIVLKKQ